MQRTLVSFARCSLPRAFNAGQPLSTSSAAQAMGSHMSDNDPQTLEAEKRKQHKGTQGKSPIDHSPGWNEKLASESESVVKSEKHDKDPHDLQRQSVEHLKAHREKDDAESGHEPNPTKKGKANPVK